MVLHPTQRGGIMMTWMSISGRAPSLLKLLISIFSTHSRCALTNSVNLLRRRRCTQLQSKWSFLVFRKVDCFRLGWPMRSDADFFNPSGSDGKTTMVCLQRASFWITSLCSIFASTYNSLIVREPSSLGYLWLICVSVFHGGNTSRVWTQGWLQKCVVCVPKSET